MSLILIGYRLCGLVSGALITYSFAPYDLPAEYLTKNFFGGGIIKLSAVLADTNKPRMGEYEEKDSRRDAGGGCNRDAAFRLRKEK